MVKTKHKNNFYYIIFVFLILLILVSGVLGESASPAQFDINKPETWASATSSLQFSEIAKLSSNSEFSNKLSAATSNTAFYQGLIQKARWSDFYLIYNKFSNQQLQKLFEEMLKVNNPATGKPWSFSDQWNSIVRETAGKSKEEYPPKGIQERKGKPEFGLKMWEALRDKPDLQKKLWDSLGDKDKSDLFDRIALAGATDKKAETANKVRQEIINYIYKDKYPIETPLKITGFTNDKLKLMIEIPDSTKTGVADKKYIIATDKNGKIDLRKEFKEISFGSFNTGIVNKEGFTIQADIKLAPRNSGEQIGIIRRTLNIGFDQILMKNGVITDSREREIANIYYGEGGKISVYSDDNKNILFELEGKDTWIRTKEHGESIVLIGNDADKTGDGKSIISLSADGNIRTVNANKKAGFLIAAKTAYEDLNKGIDSRKLYIKSSDSLNLYIDQEGGKTGAVSGINEPSVTFDSSKMELSIDNVLSKTGVLIQTINKPVENLNIKNSENIEFSRGVNNQVQLLTKINGNEINSIRQGEVATIRGVKYKDDGRFNQNNNNGLLINPNVAGVDPSSRIAQVIASAGITVPGYTPGTQINAEGGAQGGSQGSGIIGPGWSSSGGSQQGGQGGQQPGQQEQGSQAGQVGAGGAQPGQQGSSQGSSQQGSSSSGTLGGSSGGFSPPSADPSAGSSGSSGSSQGSSGSSGGSSGSSGGSSGSTGHCPNCPPEGGQKTYGQKEAEMFRTGKLTTAEGKPGTYVPDGKGYFRSDIAGGKNIKYATAEKLTELSAGKTISVDVSEPSWCDECARQARSDGTYITSSQAKALFGLNIESYPSTIRIRDGKLVR
ncbi:MAG: hypothetical protein Q8N99_07710 [Nanoarchaeota archaeon]|nr:hypothetical protein [Nanoarchaeota archaeon]